MVPLRDGAGTGGRDGAGTAGHKHTPEQRPLRGGARATAEGMRRAVLGGVETIEPGDGGTPDVWQLMVEKGVTLCPTLVRGSRA